MQADQAVRILSSMQGPQPLSVGVPLVKPGCSRTIGKTQRAVFKYSQRQTGLPINSFEMNRAISVLNQICDREISKHQLAFRFAARQYQGLPIRAAIDPDGIVIGLQILAQ